MIVIFSEMTPVAVLQSNRWTLRECPPCSLWMESAWCHSPWNSVPNSNRMNMESSFNQLTVLSTWTKNISAFQAIAPTGLLEHEHPNYYYYFLKADSPVNRTGTSWWSELNMPHVGSLRSHSRHGRWSFHFWYPFPGWLLEGIFGYYCCPPPPSSP